MKKVLLTTTAMAFAASMASAGDMSMSGAIKLTYVAFGTGTAKPGTDDFTSFGTSKYRWNKNKKEKKTLTYTIIALRSINKWRK